MHQRGGREREREIDQEREWERESLLICNNPVGFAIGADRESERAGG